MYGQEVDMPMEFIIPSLHIVVLIELTDSDVVEKRLLELVELEEDQFVTGFHQQVHKARENVWHDQNIKQKKFQVGYLALFYDNKFMLHPRKFRMHSLGPYVIR